MVLVIVEPHKGYVTESAELSSVVPRLGLRDMENPAPSKGTPKVLYLSLS